MRRLTVLALRAVVALLLLGTVLVQAVMVPLLWIDLEELSSDVDRLRVPFLVIVILGVAAAQVVLVCVWRLLSLVRRGTLFSREAFRYVDVVIGAFAAAALLVFALGVLLAPGEAVAPGIVLLLGGIGLGVLGVALVVLVVRMLLGQAIARDREAARMRAELEAVI